MFDVCGPRCAKRHNLVRSKAINYQVLAVIPGPSIPKNMRPYLGPTARAFKRFGLDTDGLEVRGGAPSLAVLACLRLVSLTRASKSNARTALRTGQGRCCMVVMWGQPT